jgi:hypothetical protein
MLGKRENLSITYRNGKKDFCGGEEENANRWQLTRMRTFGEETVWRNSHWSLCENWHLWLIPIHCSLAHPHRPSITGCPVYLRSCHRQIERQFPMVRQMDCFRLETCCLLALRLFIAKRHWVLSYRGFLIEEQKLYVLRNMKKSSKGGNTFMRRELNKPFDHFELTLDCFIN